MKQILPLILCMLFTLQLAAMEKPDELMQDSPTVIKNEFNQGAWKNDPTTAALLKKRAEAIGLQKVVLGITRFQNKPQRKNLPCKRKLFE